MKKKRLDSIKNYNEYKRSFNLHYSKGNKIKHRTPIYIVIHRITSKIPIGEIRRHTAIASLLSKIRARMNVHQWTEDDVCISNLGFFVGFNPSNILSDQMTKLVKSRICQVTGIEKKKIPKFTCGLASPFTINRHGRRISTRAFDVQCRQKDARTLIRLMQQSYTDDASFVFHKIRHTPNSAVYTCALISQNNFLQQICVVPITGVSHEVMWYLEPHLLDMEGVHMVALHTETQKH